jgi:penicillin amidase
MISLKRIFLFSVITFACLLAAIWFGGRSWLAGSVMPTSGTVQIAALDEEVEVLFDDRGIPRIYARTDRDAIRALGWLHASERLFQMELLRRVARGELAVLIGAAGLESDRLHRRYGFARRIQQDPPSLSAESERLIDAYVGGINARLSSGRDLPPEFLILQIEPEAWTRADVLMLAYYQTWYPTTLVQRMAEAWRVSAEQFGPEAAEWLGSFPDWGVPSVPVPTGRITEASNTWVVAPDRSASGAALHASDPHLDYSLAPGLWYAAGLHSDESLDVLGVTAPGLPFVAMGHNGRIAFAFTVAPVDLFEIYRFVRDPRDPDQLVGPDGPITLQTLAADFEISGQDEVRRDTLLLTELGPATALDDGRVEVLHWAGFRLPIGGLIDQGLAINRAEDFDSFRRAASDMGALSVNWSYSDRRGNIGYVQSTPIPRRQHTGFYTPLDGARAEHYWAGFVEPDQRPFALNPEQGWLANSNNHAAVDTTYPLPGFYKQLRMRRAVDWLTGRETFTPEAMRRMQLDRTSDRALSWKGWLADVADAQGQGDLAQRLRDWDGVMHADSELAGLFAHWWQVLPRHLFDKGPLEDWRIGRTLLDDWLHRPTEGFAIAVIDRDEAAARALGEVLDHGIRPLGEIQTLTINHPLAVSAPLNAWLDLSRGPLPIGSGPGSLNVTYHAWNEGRQTLTARAGASMRYVMDWSDPDAFSLNLTLGQSGHPLSPHFDDQLDDFMSGEPWIVPFSREAVEARSRSTLLLKPADGLAP